MLNTAVLLAASMVVGQATLAAEPKKDAAPQVTDLAWLLGEWHGEYVLPAGLPEVGPAGSKVLSMQTWRRTLDRKFISLKIREEIDGRVASTGEEILGTDQDTGALAQWFFGSTGVHGVGTWHRNGERWELKWRAAAPGGKKYEAIADHIQLDADTYTWQLRDLTENGKKVPDWPKVTYHRKKTPAVDDVWKAYRDAVIGTWEGSGIIGRNFKDLGLAKGDRFAYRLTWKSDLEGRALMGEGDFRTVDKDHNAKVRILASWDPGTAQVRSLAVWSTGLVEEILIDRKEGTAFLGTYAAKSPGSRAERSRTCTEVSNADSVVIKFLDGPRKGDVLSSWKRVK
jgi:hypothetical protein